ncbi:hypothetical protein [Moorella sp. ACPs]|uniref:hypothetical protein n=1 Tax=Neomoorella carbonis TaxID=3062783 RepID=UPI00324BED10
MLDSRRIPITRLETSQDWLERLQWLGIKVEKPQEESSKQAGFDSNAYNCRGLKENLEEKSKESKPYDG